MSALRFRSSGDLAADRRYLWGEGARADGDHVAAADLYRQAVELQPGWAAGWFAFGRSALEAGRADEARAALLRCLQLEPDDMMGASLLLARLRGDRTEMPPAYVACLFDDYAERFDAHLTGRLGYRGPAVIVEALRRVCEASGGAKTFRRALDLGCGTGLMGRELKGIADRLDGVDLSERMLDQARATGLYATLAKGDATSFLRAGIERYDLILAADVLVYIGDLKPLFDAARSRMHEDALFAFTVQRCEGDGVSLGDDLRYAHSQDYIRETSRASGLSLLRLDDASTRQEAGREVPGLVAILTVATS